MIISNEIITSRNNDFVKWASSLQEKKGRNEAESFIAEGVKLSLEALDASLPVTHIIVEESRRSLFEEKFSSHIGDEKFNSVKVIYVSESVLQKISTEKAPQGIISIIKYLDFSRRLDIIYKVDNCLHKDERAIILSSVRDPSNLGAIIRSSVAFGTDRIILSEDCADEYSPKTVRSAMGSLFRVKLSRVSDLPRCIGLIRESGRRVFAAELTDDARSVREVGFSSSDVVVVGNEGHGIDPSVSGACDASVYIPISKKTESLNASVAAAIFMWEQSKG
ncbi:MAG: RNA methyltransferase [Clostridia bacterium]|nr:RNA methyltransferase [Clostridia bacterium]